MSAPGQASGHRVLVVDDTDSKRYIISSWLRRAGHQVEEAGTGAQALARCARGGVDLVVLDVHLPDMTGLEVCRQLKRAEETAAVPVLHISAVAIEPADRSEGLDHGADAYLVDPIEPRELVSTVAALLRYYDARRAAENLVTRLHALSTATLRMNAALTGPALLTAAADGAADVLGAPTTVLLEGADGEWFSSTAAPGVAATRALALPAERVEPLLAPMRGPAAVAADDDPRWAALLPVGGGDGGGDGGGQGRGDAWVTPVRDRLGKVVVALAVATTGPPPAPDRQLAQQLALVVAVARENRRSYAQLNQVALTLQRNLLPTRAPRLPGLRVAARYNASNDDAEVGGDFFDAFEVADGTAVVAIGDVQGHSVQAATIMGELRHGLRAFAHEGHTGGVLLERLNQVMLREHPDVTATVCLMAVDRARTSVSVVNAGHIPPLLVAGGRADFLEESTLLLGIEAPQRTPFTVPLPAGFRLVLVTDGLVERRSASLEAGMGRLAAEAARLAATDLDEFADVLMRDLGAGSEDDIALIAVQAGPVCP